MQQHREWDDIEGEARKEKIFGNGKEKRKNTLNEPCFYLQPHYYKGPKVKATPKKEG